MRSQPPVSRSVLIRDLLVFNLKLWMDGLKDIVLAPLSLGAGVFDILRGPTTRGHRAYSVMRLGERFDQWLDLYGSAAHVENAGLEAFGREASRARAPALADRVDAEPEARIGNAPR